MIVEIAPEVFATTSTADIMVFRWLGAIGRHRIVVPDDGALDYASWLRTLDDATREDWQKVIDDGVRLNAHEPSVHEIRVVASDTSHWTPAPPTLTVEDAIDLLHRPYRVLLENGFSDGAFLLSMCDRETRAFLEARRASEWVEFEHCGGLGDMEKRTKELRKTDSTRMRCSTLFQGDAMQPGRSSCESNAVRDLCLPDVHHHQLERRAIENYLPRAALDRWCKQTDGKARRNRQAQIDALFALSEARRAHYNMKEGFEKDAPNAFKAGDLWNGFQGEPRRVLDNGLDKHLAQLYRDGAVRFEELEAGPAVRNVQEFAREIVARIR